MIYRKALKNVNSFLASANPNQHILFAILGYEMAKIISNFEWCAHTTFGNILVIDTGGALHLKYHYSHYSSVYIYSETAVSANTAVFLR